MASIKFAVRRSAENPRLLSTALRAGVAILYAHWEGFLKSSAENYIEFVSRQNLRNDQLSPNFLALSARRMLTDTMNIGRAEQAIALVRFFLEDMSKPSALAYRNAISTESNLSSKVLRNIVFSLGLNYAHFETKAVLIDEKLLAKRNGIAHGQFLDIDLVEFEELFKDISTLLETWRNELENACVTRRYLNTSPTA